MKVIYQKVTKIEVHDKGWITLVLSCGHHVPLHPTPSETSEEKADRFQNYIGEDNPCAACMRRQRNGGQLIDEKAYQHCYYEKVTKPRRHSIRNSRCLS